MGAGDTEISLGGIEPDELDEFVRAFARPFGEVPPDGAVERIRRVFEPDRAVAMRRPDGTIVGTAGAYTFDLALPGASPAGCAGITVVSVRGDHRRRGLLTRMMARLLDDAAERGEPFAALWASEAPIYGRFGFGPAVPTLEVEIPRPHGRLRADGSLPRVLEVPADEALPTVSRVYEAVRQHRPGLLSRSTAWWERILSDSPEQRDGAGPLCVSTVGDRGYAIHRLHPRWDDGAPTGTVLVEDLVALDPAATAALWRHLIDTDLASRLRAARRPVDDPVLALLSDTGRARLVADEPLYLRLVDVPRAMEARRYAVDGELVLDVHDASRPANQGRWRLAVRDGRAVCEATASEADLRLDVEALATVFLGGVRTTMLAEAGRVAPLRRDAPMLLDRLLATPLAPWHAGMF